MQTTKEIRQGYTYKQRGAGRSSIKLPFFCPYEQCNKITSTLDDKYMLEYGVCMNCYVMYIENRKKPLIDTTHYVKRLKDRGF